MSDDLVMRLRDLGDRAAFEPHMHHEAAAEITRLRARVAKLEGALRNARARYIELSDKDAAEAMAEIINEALGDVK